jgi:transcriptional regulator with XRE-family HTH domain
MRSKTVDRLLKSTPKDVEIFVDWYADLVVRINQLLRENDISKKELAEKMDKKPSEISKWLSGEHNFTLRSLAKLSVELGEPLMEVTADAVSYYLYGFESCQDYKKLNIMYKLTREKDNKTIIGEQVKFIEWDEYGRFSNKHDEPAEGRSVMIDPHHFSYTWLTTEITSFTKDGNKLIFSTKNSNYILEIED